MTSMPPVYYLSDMPRSIPPVTPGQSSAHQKKLQMLVAQLGEMGFALPGSVGTVMARCGKPACRCHRDPALRHGPYTLWTRKVKGKTVTRTLTDEQLRRYQPWMDAHRQLRKLVRELEALSLRAAEDAEGWSAQHPRSPRQKTPAS